MRWTPGGRSTNLEDRRAQGGGFRRGGVGLGLGGIVLLLILTALTGQDFLSQFLASPEVLSPGPSTADRPSTPEEERLVDFVSFVLDDAQATWHRLLPNQYEDAQLVLFRDVTRSACGLGESATGPFYCPGDRKVYIDLGFYDELQRRFGAPGDFAQAYVLAHELGHHVQTLLGIEPQVRQMQQRSPGSANELSVRLELQADCLAGVWGNSTARREILEQGDVEEGLNAAAAIGDDRIQSMTRGRVQPEAFTHGSSEQRISWFRKGLSSGDPDSCNTFQAGS
jgi:predicted metalloprotease